jgi:Mg2+ and Co2+ transporter CorA
MLRRDLLRLRHAAGPLVEVCNRLEHTQLMPIDKEMQPHFRDVTDHVRRVSADIDALREVLAFAFEASLMAGQAQQTVTARRLAAWAAILAVPTAIAGIYGMNFEHMPELKWEYSYFRNRGHCRHLRHPLSAIPPQRLALAAVEQRAPHLDPDPFCHGLGGIGFRP